MNDERQTGGATAAAATPARAGTRTTGTRTGKVVQVIGPVLDVEFEYEDLPAINTALRLDYEPAEGEDGEAVHVTAEIQQ
ncbi:MAG TPA: hypothetical protein VJ982_13525, partial [Gemmatimonadota bacterium]|nr:hypothetical protein [Gemmatimonadota bacterium]